jgi:large subunit ribosomal protein L21
MTSLRPDPRAAALDLAQNLQFSPEVAEIIDSPSYAVANICPSHKVSGGPMYAIIRAGGKQYKVEAGDTVRVEKLEKNLGDQFDLAEVLMVGGDKAFVGSPLVQGAKVTAVVTRQAKAPKIIVFKKKRRQGYRRMQGHRQLFTELFIQSITTPEGQQFKTDKKAQVIDPVKTAARKAAAPKKVAKTAGADTAQAAAGGAKKKTAKKASTGGAKKAGAKKTGAKKPSGKTAATRKS